MPGLRGRYPHSARKAPLNSQQIAEADRYMQWARGENSGIAEGKIKVWPVWFQQTSKRIHSQYWGNAIRKNWTFEKWSWSYEE